MNDENAMLSLLRHRRSVPPQALGGAGPDDAQLRELLRLAARVPDHGKLAPWRFIVIRGEARQKMASIIESVYVLDHPHASAAQRQAERARMTEAPLIIAVVSRARPHVKIPQWEQQLSAGAVCLNVLIAAHAMGFAGSWLTQWHSYDRRVLDQVGLEADEKIAGYIHIGHAQQTIDDRARPDVEALTTYFGQ
jgi:nitroreductase